MNPVKKTGNYRHGLAKTKIWFIYMGIKSRCLKQQHYLDINCLWSTFDDFYRDMGKKYLDHVRAHGERKTTIERIDSKGDYCKKNCRWATPSEQSRNTSQNHWITYKGQTKCLTDWAKQLGIKKTTLTMRFQYGWSVQRAFNTKPQGGIYH